MNPFEATPAGTPVAPSTSARYYYRRQVFSRNPVTNDNFKAGRTVNLNFESSGGHYAVLQESRIVADLEIKAADGTKLSKSVRFATDPISSMFSSAMLSVNGTTVESHAANVDDISRIQLRTEQTKQGADGPGSAGLLSFNQKMTQEEQQSADLDGLAGGSTYGKTDGTAANAKTAIKSTYSTTDERSDKHELLLNNCSASDKAADGSETKSVEISAPLSQIFTFARQDKSFLPNMSFQIALTISDDFEKNAFFSELLKGTASSAGVYVEGATVKPIGDGTGGTAAGATDLFALSGFVTPIQAVTDAPKVTVKDLYLDAMFAVPSVPMPPPTSMQVPFQAISVYTRTLTTDSNFTESFSSIPASIGACVVALRDSTAGINQNRELYSVGGGSSGFKSFSFQLGALQLPQPAYKLDIESRQFGRLFADWLSFTGGSASNGVGADSLTEFAKSVLIPIRVLQDPGSYASTATLRFETKAALPANTELVLWVIHQRVFEAFWEQGQSQPSRVIVDDVLN